MNVTTSGQSPTTVTKTSLESIESYNKNHALNRVNHVIRDLVWTLGLGALLVSFLPVTLPWLGALPGALGLHQTIDNLIIQAGLLFLFVNTNNIYEYYVCKLEYPIFCRLGGSVVYLAHLVSIVISFKNPLYWLWCVSAILLLRSLINLQLYQYIKKRTQTHPWLGLLRGWLKRSWIDTALVALYAGLVLCLTNVRFYAWAHGFPIASVDTPVGQALVRDIYTLLILVAVYQIGTHAFQQVRMNPSFTREEIEEHYAGLSKFYND